MPLIDILTDIAAEFGQAGNDADRNLRVFRINKAAKEIHQSIDLEEALDEEIFAFNQDSSQQITVPAYIHKVRGARYVDGRIPISIDDMRNRYGFQWLCENETWYLKPRAKGVSPLSRDISNQSVITLSIPLAESFAFSVTIVGKTDNSNRFTETLTFAIGETQKVSSGNYISVESVTKTQITTYDVILEDVEGNELGRILNSEYQSAYRLYQIMDEESTTQLPTNFSGVELNFKKKFQPFKNDYDCFLGTDRFDPAIFWKYCEHRTKDPKESPAFLFKCNQVLSQAAAEDTPGIRRKVQYRPQPFFNLPYNSEGLKFYR